MSGNRIKLPVLRLISQKCLKTFHKEPKKLLAGVKSQFFSRINLFYPALKLAFRRLCVRSQSQYKSTSHSLTA